MLITGTPKVRKLTVFQRSANWVVKKNDREYSSFEKALVTLEAKTVNGQIVVENPHRQLARFAFCAKGQPSKAATRRYREILKNIGD